MIVPGNVVHVLPLAFTRIVRVREPRVTAPSSTGAVVTTASGRMTTRDRAPMAPTSMASASVARGGHTTQARNGKRRRKRELQPTVGSHGSFLTSVA